MVHRVFILISPAERSISLKMTFDLRNRSQSPPSAVANPSGAGASTAADAIPIRPPSRTSLGRPTRSPRRALICCLLASLPWASQAPTLTAQEPASTTDAASAVDPATAADVGTTEAGTATTGETAQSADPPVEDVAAPPAAVAPAPSLPVPPHPLALPSYGSSRLDGFFHIRLDSGDVYFTDRLDGPPVRSRRLSQNITQEIGLATGMSIGDLLIGPIRDNDGSLKAAVLVEAATGYVAFLDDIGRDSKLGTISVAIDRPFQALAADDRGAALLMRRDSSGRTVGAYLYHGPSGRALYLDGLRKLDPAGQVTATVPWPTLSGRAAAVALQSSREETIGYWLGDPTSGVSYRVSLSRDSPTRIGTRKLTANLFESIAGRGPHATYEPLVAVGLEDRSGETRHIFLLAVSSGEMAVWLDVAGDGGAPRLVKLPRNLYEVLGRQPVPVPRTIEAVPRLGDNGVDGVYLLDSVTRGIILAGNLTQPGNATLSHYGTFGG